MISFKSFASIAVIALGALSVIVAATIPLVETTIATRVGPPNLPYIIIAQVTESMTPLVAQLRAIRENRTVEVLAPIVDAIKTALSDALTDVNGLVEEPSRVILASVDGASQTSAQDLAQTISDLMNLVQGAVSDMEDIGAVDIRLIPQALIAALQSLLSKIQT